MVLTAEEHHVLLDIFEQYLMSYVNIKLTAEYRFIMDYIKAFYGEYEYEDFFQKCIKKRKDHIEWLFGSDNEDGQPEFNMPTTYAEMKVFLTNYDMEWLGDR